LRGLYKHSHASSANKVSFQLFRSTTVERTGLAAAIPSFAGTNRGSKHDDGAQGVNRLQDKISEIKHLVTVVKIDRAPNGINIKWSSAPSIVSSSQTNATIASFLTLLPWQVLPAMGHRLAQAGGTTLLGDPPM
jgi:hypothetical protein